MTTPAFALGSRLHSLQRLTVALLCAVLLAAVCEKNQLEKCTKNEDCGDNRFCEEETGVCLCANDDGCSDDEFCNPLFMCQIIAGCRDNTECTGDTICDIKSGRCIGDDQCTLNTHCDFNNVCDNGLGRCVLGCWDEADCVLGYACIGATRTTVGQCAVGICRGDDLCGFQEICDLASGECYFDDRGPYCGACQNLWSEDECGGGANYCLVDTGDASGASYYCGVDCSQGQSCPYGYECHDVIILPPAAPICRTEACLNGHCSRSGGPCDEHEDCAYGPPGGDCARAKVGNCRMDQGRPCEQDDDCCEEPPCPENGCVRQLCRGGEGDLLGHCTCTRDLDCPADECRGADLTDPENQIPGECLIGGHDCYDDIDCDVITCVEGGCLIGSNCAPADDRTCRDLAIE